MAEEGKKISFGFSKSVKKPVLKNTPAPEVKKVDFIECLDGKSIKVIGGEEKKKDNVLVIPMPVQTTWHERIMNQVDADIYEPKANKSTTIKTIKQEHPANSSVQNGNGAGDGIPMDVTQIKAEPAEEKAPLSLEEMAAQELIQDSMKEPRQDEIKNQFILPMKEQNDLAGVQEPTLEDYDKVAVEQFGLAMLRGMGFKEEALSNKDPNAPHLRHPEVYLRPRGMGLGADKLVAPKETKRGKTKEEEELKLQTGGYVKILGGMFKHNYGQVEGFDYDLERVIVKLALTGYSESLPESLVEPVTKTDYDKNSKVLNASKYEEYKNKSSKNETREKISSSDSSRKSRRYDSDEESSDSDRRRPRKRKSSSESEDDYRERKSKKKSKHRERESSNHGSRKSKKKDKDREGTRDRRDHSKSPDRRKSSKKNKRSRS